MVVSQKNEDQELNAELLKRQLESRLSRKAKALADGDALIGKMVSGLISTETLFENELFQDISVGDGLIHEIQSILKNPKCLIDKYFTHVWMDADGKKVTWEACVHRRKKSAKCTYMVGYWLPGEEPSDDEIYDVKLSSLLNAYIRHDIQF